MQKTKVSKLQPQITYDFYRRMTTTHDYHLQDRHCSLVSELTHHFSRKVLTRLAKATTRRNELLNQELL